MKQNLSKALSSAVLQLLRPLMRILLRNGVPYGAFADLAKRVYVRVAMEEFGISERKQSVSRVSVITGLSRKEVSRVNNLPDTEDAGTIERYNRAARVVSGWVRDGRFADRDGKPADLSLEGKGTTFNELVKLFSGDVPVRAVLDELQRVGVVKRLTDGRIRLLTHAYIPSREEVDKLNILGTDVKDLICTIDHNLISDAGKSFLQRKVSYDNLPEDVLPELRKLATKRGQSLLEELDLWLSQRDRDINPSSKGTGRKRAGIGIYYFEDDTQEEGEKT